MNSYAELMPKSPDRAKAGSLREPWQIVSGLRRDLDIRRLQERANKSPKVERLWEAQALANRKFGNQLSKYGESNKTGLPGTLRADVEHRSGVSMQDVVVHRNSQRPAQLQALAYAEGSHIYLAPGQEEHLPHEAWHVAQQKQGRVRPTVQLRGISINTDSTLEREAEAFATNAFGPAPRPQQPEFAQPSPSSQIAQRYCTYSNGEITSHQALHDIVHLLPHENRADFISSATAGSFEGSLLSHLTSFNLDERIWDLIRQAAQKDGGTLNPWWKLDSQAGQNDTSRREIEASPEIEETAWQAVTSESSGEAAKPPSAAGSHHSGTDIFGLSRFVQALKKGEYWITHFKYLHRDQAGILRLLGLEDVTRQVVAQEKTESFPHGELYIYKKVSPLPPQWIDAVHGWYGQVRHILNATSLGVSVKLSISNEFEEDLYQTQLSESRLIFPLLWELMDESQAAEMRSYLEAAYDQMKSAMDHADRNMM